MVATAHSSFEYNSEIGAIALRDTVIIFKTFM
jgi:hypothetical protein